MDFITPLPSFPYHFTPHTSNTALRRDFLDAAGRYAQVASDIFVVVVFLYFNIFVPTRGKINNAQDQSKKQQSPKIESQGRLNERVNTTVLTGQRESKGSVILTSVWAVVVVLLLMWRTGDDYLHITRSPAQVASALLGANLVFALPFLRDFTPQLISFHRLQSLLIFGLLGVHAALYLNFYIQNNLLAKRVQDIDVQLGIALSAISACLWWTGAGMQRLKGQLGADRARLVHVTLSSALGVGLWFHVVHSRANLRRAGLVWAMGQGWRIWKDLTGLKSAAVKTRRIGS